MLMRVSKSFVANLAVAPGLRRYPMFGSGVNRRWNSGAASDPPLRRKPASNTPNSTRTTAQKTAAFDLTICLNPMPWTGPRNAPAAALAAAAGPAS